MSILKNKEILVTGGTGLLGHALQDLIPEAIFLTSKHGDLRNFEECKEIFQYHKPQLVIHLAARVGGVSANQKYMGDFYRDNILINTNVLEAARQFKVEKLISLMSTCVYPNSVNYPLTEDQLHNGVPHTSNFGYAYAKRALDFQSRSYRKQFNCNFITAIPNNIFGPYDNFDLENSHVVPAMIRKIYEAKLMNKNVELWSSKAIREFTSAKDIAKAILFLLENYDGEDPVNIGNTEEYTIEEMATLISIYLGFSGEIKWNNTNLGQLKKPSSNKKFLDLGWKKEYYNSVEDALEDTCKWFVENYPIGTIRGINGK